MRRPGGGDNLEFDLVYWISGAIPMAVCTLIFAWERAWIFSLISAGTAGVALWCARGAIRKKHDGDFTWSRYVRRLWERWRPIPRDNGDD
jgi:hypothetical protein